MLTELQISSADTVALRRRMQTLQDSLILGGDASPRLLITNNIGQLYEVLTDTKVEATIDAAITSIMEMYNIYTVTVKGDPIPEEYITRIEKECWISQLHITKRESVELSAPKPVTVFGKPESDKMLFTVELDSKNKNRLHILLRHLQSMLTQTTTLTQFAHYVCGTKTTVRSDAVITEVENTTLTIESNDSVEEEFAVIVDELDPLQLEELSVTITPANKKARWKFGAEHRFTVKGSKTVAPKKSHVQIQLVDGSNKALPLGSRAKVQTVDNLLDPDTYYTFTGVIDDAVFFDSIEVPLQSILGYEF